MPTRRSIFPLLWTLGALAVCVGGYWFWFFIRADVLAEGKSPLQADESRSLHRLPARQRHVRPDLVDFSRSVDAPGSMLFLGLYLIATTVLFGSIPWSKFSHMFFKPAAALQKAGGRGQRYAGTTCRRLPTDPRPSASVASSAQSLLGLQAAVARSREVNPSPCRHSCT